MEPSSFSEFIEDSDDEELPDLFSEESISENKYEISRGDIVWAKYRQLFWPSLVRFVYKKNKKVLIWYLDSPKKTFKVPLSKIKTFSDPKVNTLIRKKLESSPLKAKHTQVWLNALTYIRRQAEGYNDDPAAYFDLTRHYFISNDSEMHLAVKDQKEMKDDFVNETVNEESKVSSDEIDDLFSSNEEFISENKDKISRGDIVWAKFQKLFWPSLVRFIHKNENKVSIWYLDSPNKTFKVPLSKIKTFSDPKVNTLIREEVRSSPMKAKHTQVWLNALTYIRRQAEGHNDDPAAYFDLTQHYFASKDSEMHLAENDQIEMKDDLVNETVGEESN